MAWRFRKSIGLGKGIRLNFGKKSIGLSIGGKGLHMGINSKKGVYTSAGIPGTGLYTQQYVGSGSRSSSGGSSYGSMSFMQGIKFVWNAIVLFILGAFILMFILEPNTRGGIGVVLGLWGLMYFIFVFNSKGGKVKRLINKAIKLKDNDQQETAIEVLKDAFNINAENYGVNFLLGCYLHNEGKFNDAKVYIQNAINLNGDDMQCKVLLANCYYQTKQYEMAIPLLQMIPEDYDRYIKVIELLGSCFAQLKKYDIAIETYKKAPLLKRNLDADLLEVHYNLGIIYNDSGDPHRALKHLKKVYAVDAGYNKVAKMIEDVEADCKKTKKIKSEDGETDEI